MVELLKQDQYCPMPVEKQVVSIFAGVNGLLDDLPVTSVGRFEKELLDFMDKNNPEIFSAIRETKMIEDNMKEKLLKVIAGFKTGFSAEAKV